MAHLYLTRTVHMPVTSDGCAIKNSFGVVIATANDSWTADALAQIINLGHAGAGVVDRREEEREKRAAKLFRNLSANPLP